MSDYAPLPDTDHKSSTAQESPARTDLSTAEAQRSSDFKINPSNSNGDLPTDNNITAKLHSTNVPLSRRQQMAINLGKTNGNRYVQRLLDAPPTIQRDGEGGSPTWSPPSVFEIESTNLTTRQDAGLAALVMSDRMSSIQRIVPAGYDTTALANSARSISTLIRQMGTEGDLTQDNINQLNIYTVYAETAMENALTAIRQEIRLNLRSLASPPDTSGLDQMEARIAEQLHTTFINGANDSAVASLRAGLDAINDYKSKADTVATWAGRVTSMVGASRINEMITRFSTNSELLGQGLTRLRQVVQAADVVQSLATANHTDVGTNQHSLAQFRAAVDAIDLAMSFASAVPLIGTLWSDFYAPMTRSILNMLEIIFNLQDRQGREMQMVEWMTNNSVDPSSGRAPRITPGLQQYFPGGQPVLDFMYVLMNDGDPAVTPAVDSYFREHLGQFNAGLGDRDQLQTESDSTWYNPLSWGSEERTVNLVSWLRQNGRTVWAQLYGDLPTTLRP